MSIRRRKASEFPIADESVPFDVTLTTPATAEDLVLVPGTKKGRTISIVNEGPGDIAVAFDAEAVVTDLFLGEGDEYDEHLLEISTKISFINVTVGATPQVRGILWSGK